MERWQRRRPKPPLEDRGERRGRDRNQARCEVTPIVTIRVGPRKVTARAEPEHNPQVVRAVNAAYRKKYGERWPEETDEMLKGSVVPTTLRLTMI